MPSGHLYVFSGGKNVYTGLLSIFKLWFLFFNIAFVIYKLALAMGAYHLPLQQLNHVLLLLIFNTPGGVQGGEQK